MNNDLKYAFQGVLLVVVFFIAYKVVDYSLSIRSFSESSSQVVIDYDTPSSNNTKGKQLFMQNCASCHAIHKKLTGPALTGVEERIPDKKLLHEWIRNNQKVLKSGNPYFVSLYNTYDKTPMNIFSAITDEEIDAILNYIKEQSHIEPLKAMPVVATR
jgi:mono/diheme cytochrome c family protein